MVQPLPSASLTTCKALAYGHPCQALTYSPGPYTAGWGYKPLAHG